jgi:hypothetical protein
LGIIIILAIVVVALLDFRTSSELIESILFTGLLALCALEDSQKLLWVKAMRILLLAVTARI